MGEYINAKFTAKRNTYKGKRRLIRYPKVSTGNLR